MSSSLSHRRSIRLKGADYSREFYLVYKIVPELEKEFENTTWYITQLQGYSGARNSAMPFAVSLTELMRAQIKI